MPVSEPIKSFTQGPNGFGVKGRTGGKQQRVPFHVYEEVRDQIGKFVTKLHPHPHVVRPSPPASATSRGARTYVQEQSGTCTNTFNGAIK